MNWWRIPARTQSFSNFSLFCMFFSETALFFTTYPLKSHSQTNFVVAPGDDLTSLYPEAPENASDAVLKKRSCQLATLSLTYLTFSNLHHVLDKCQLAGSNPYPASFPPFGAFIMIPAPKLQSIQYQCKGGFHFYSPLNQCHSSGRVVQGFQSLYVLECNCGWYSISCFSMLRFSVSCSVVKVSSGFLVSDINVYRLELYQTWH